MALNFPTSPLHGDLFKKPLEPSGDNARHLHAVLQLPGRSGMDG
jgi:hypothetical protein